MQLLSTVYLKDRIAGRVIHGNNLGTKPYLNPGEEKKLVDFLVTLLFQCWLLEDKGRCLANCRHHCPEEGFENGGPYIRRMVISISQDVVQVKLEKERFVSSSM